MKCPGIHPARKHRQIAETHRREFTAELGRRDKGAARPIMHPAQPCEHDAFQRAELVVPGVGVEIRVEARGHRNAQRAGSGDRRGPQRAFGGDVNEIGAVFLPGSFQPAAGGEAQPQQSVAGDGHAGQRHFHVLFRRSTCR